jgi:hypothetical protein
VSYFTLPEVGGVMVCGTRLYQKSAEKEKEEEEEKHIFILMKLLSTYNKFLEGRNMYTGSFSS